MGGEAETPDADAAAAASGLCRRSLSQPAAKMPQNFAGNTP